jgi:hypothetical protein
MEECPPWQQTSWNRQKPTDKTGLKKPGRPACLTCVDILARQAERPAFA